MGNSFCGYGGTSYVDTQALSRTFVAFVERATTTTTSSTTSTTTTLPQCDSSSYTTCSNAYTFTTSGSKSNMCGIEQYYKISTPQGKKCDVEWKLIPDSQSDYDLYVKWESDCPSRTNYDCSSLLGLGATEVCSKKDFSGTSYALVRRFSGITPYKIEVSITNCVDITTTTTSSTTTSTTTTTSTVTSTTSTSTTTTSTTSTTTTLPQDDPCDNSGTWRKYGIFCCEGDCQSDRSKIRGFCLDKERYQANKDNLELVREGAGENCVRCKNERCCQEIRSLCYDYDPASPTGCFASRAVTRVCGDAGGNTCDFIENIRNQNCVLRESSSKLGPVYCAACQRVTTTTSTTTTSTTSSTTTTVPRTTTTTTTTTTIPPEVCNDRRDNDNDGLVDCADPDCSGKPGPNGVVCCKRNEDCGENEVCLENVCKKWNFVLNLKRGWNMVSIPFKEYEIVYVDQDIVRTVFYYNASGNKYETADLKDAKLKGFWAYSFSNDKKIFVNGKVKFAPWEIQLYANLSRKDTPNLIPIPKEGIHLNSERGDCEITRFYYYNTTENTWYKWNATSGEYLRYNPQSKSYELVKIDNDPFIEEGKSIFLFIKNNCRLGIFIPPTSD